MIVGLTGSLGLAHFLPGIRSPGRAQPPQPPLPPYSPLV